MFIKCLPTIRDIHLAVVFTNSHLRIIEEKKHMLSVSHGGGQNVYILFRLAEILSQTFTLIDTQVVLLI